MKGATKLARLAAVPALVVAAGCAGGSARQPEAAPVVDARGDLPTYPGAEPAGVSERDDGTLVRRFRAPGATPREVMAFFGTRLPRWQVEDAVAPVGPATYRASWSRQGRRLVLVARPAPSVVPGTVDYSLALRDATG